MERIQMNRSLREGCKNIRRNRWMSIAATSALTFMFFLAGVAVSIIFNVHHITQKVEENVEIRAFLKEEADHQIVLTKVKNMNRVEQARFIPKEQGLTDFINSFGADGKAFDTLKEENPLNDVIVVRTKNPRDTEEVANSLKEFSSIEKIVYGENIVDPLFKTTNFIRTVGWVFIAGLSLISLFIVSNTIYLTVMARKEEIQLQKLIGATNSFVTRPFLIEGGLIGMFGAIVPVVLISIGYPWIYSRIHEGVDIALLQLMPPGIFLVMLSFGMIICGTLIGMWGAVFSVHRFLKV